KQNRTKQQPAKRTRFIDRTLLDGRKLCATQVVPDRELAAHYHTHPGGPANPQFFAAESDPGCFNTVRLAGPPFRGFPWLKRYLSSTLPGTEKPRGRFRDSIPDGWTSP